MKLYSALIKKDQKDDLFDLMLVREGFHFSALFFGIFWLCYHRIWLALLVQIVVSALLFFCFSSGYISHPQLLVMNVTLLMIYAFNADRLLEYSFKKRGYEFVAMIAGNSELDARVRLGEGVRN